jgi:uncharacterized protein YciI
VVANTRPMLYIGFGEDLPGTDEKRAAAREAHMHYLHGTTEVVVLGGQILDRNEKRMGSCLIISAPDYATAEDWFANEPFNKAGIFKSLTVARVHKGVWNPELAADTK